MDAATAQPAAVPEPFVPPAGFPRDWYWLADDGRVYASARQAVVAKDDADLAAWTAAGGYPTAWPRDASNAQTDAALQEVLAPYGLAATLADLKGLLKSQVDTAAEALRLTLITPGSGQAMEYQEAYAEAVQIDAAVKASAGATFDPAAYPMLAASLGFDIDPTTGKPTTDIPGEARAVLAAYDAYQKAGASIRGARLKAKASIDATADAAAAQAAFDAIAWPPFG